MPARSTNVRSGSSVAMVVDPGSCNGPTPIRWWNDEPTAGQASSTSGTAWAPTNHAG